jgi:hypothetical protein
MIALVCKSVSSNAALSLGIVNLPSWIATSASSNLSLVIAGFAALGATLARFASSSNRL